MQDAWIENVRSIYMPFFKDAFQMNKIPETGEINLNK